MNLNNKRNIKENLHINLILMITNKLKKAKKDKGNIRVDP
jgi:hypothetical protein